MGRYPRDGRGSLSALAVSLRCPVPAVRRLREEIEILAATAHALELTQTAAEAAADKLGTDLVAYDVSEQLAITDVFLVVTANNERQVGSVVDGIEEALRELDARPVRREG